MKAKPRTMHRGSWITLYVAVSAATITTVASATQLAEAKVTAVVHDVKLLRGEAVLRPAVVNDEVREGTAVRTGIESRSELTFPNLTIARLGANTIFSFNEEAREVKLFNGAILLRVPKNSGGAKITTDAVTAGILGTTVMMEFHPRGIAKFIVLEGVARLYLKNRLGESILVHAGEMMIVPTGARRLNDPVEVDISQLMRTSLLITGFAPLPSASLVASAESKQMQMKSEGQLIETNLVIYGSGTLVSLADETDQRFAATPATDEFGPLNTITAPDPFPITSATRINTDPTITTEKITVSGKIYRDPSDDGPLSKYLFGSTSLFDKALNYDTEFFADPNNLPVAFFKFQNLALMGNPTIAVGHNGVTKLGLVGVEGITSGPPGGNLTFDGLDLLVVATQAGSIDLTSDLSFQNLNTLVIYARGAGSNLTLASPISGITKLRLAAENTVEIDADAIFSDLDVTAGGDLRTAGPNNSVILSVENGGGTLNDLAQIRLSAGTNLLGRDLSLLIANNNGGHIGGDATISINAGNITETSLLADIDNSNGGVIAKNAIINMNVPGKGIVSTDATFQILGSDGAASAAVSINGGSYIIGGAFLGFIDGNGSFNLNNATIAADTVKLGVFGSNGTLRIGGGSISANTLLHLYAGGSNGIIDFVRNVTLSTLDSPAAIAANTVTIENGVVVTIGGSIPANVFTNVPNYSGSRGNGNTTGTFAGAGATTQPLSQVPPFAAKRTNSDVMTLIGTVAPSQKTGFAADPSHAPSRTHVRTASRSSSSKGHVVRVSDTSQLQSLLDSAAPRVDGKVRVSSATRGRNTSMRSSAGTIIPTKNAIRPADAKMPSRMLALRCP